MLLYYKDAVFSADQGDIIVKGNTEKRGGNNPILNSLVFATNGTSSMDSVVLRAQEGRTVTFYDPFRNEEDGAEYDNIVYDFNKSEGVTPLLMEERLPNSPEPSAFPERRRTG